MPKVSFDEIVKSPSTSFDFKSNQNNLSQDFNDFDIANEPTVTC